MLRLWNIWDRFVSQFAMVFVKFESNSLRSISAQPHNLMSLDELIKPLSCSLGTLRDRATQRLSDLSRHVRQIEHHLGGWENHTKEGVEKIVKTETEHVSTLTENVCHNYKRGNIWQQMVLTNNERIAAKSGRPRIPLILTWNRLFFLGFKVILS